MSESENSALSKSRGKEPHLTSHTLEKIVTTIQEQSELGPLSPRIEAVVNAKMQAESISLAEPECLDLSSNRNLPFSTESSCISSTTAVTVSTARQSDHRDSETSVSSTDTDGLIRSGSVVHGFSPAASSFRSSRARLSQGQPSLASSLRSSQAKNLQAPANKSMFTLGGSSEDDESSFDSRMSPYRRPPSDVRASSLTKTLANKGLAQKAAPSFKAIVEQHRLQKQKQQRNDNEDEGAIESSDEEDDDDAVGSATDEEEEDDEEEWEDSHSEDGKEHHREHIFKRIDSRPNLTSRRSVLTQGLTESDRASGLANAASKLAPITRKSRGASLNGPSMPGSPEENEEDSGMMMQRSKGAKPLPIIPTTSNTYAMAHSPRTTRRNMLSTELTQSLRQNLLWERQQKNTTVNAFIKRQAQSMANLQKLNQPPQPLPNTNGLVNGGRPSVPFMSKEPVADNVTKNNGSWNHYFDNPWEYHAKGW